MRKDLAPRTIGPYAITETVEVQAFHVTYRGARDDIGRKALIRTLRPTVAETSPYAAALRREAAILGRLDHEAIQRLYDFEGGPAGLYLVLEDAAGPTLRALMKAGRVEPEGAAAIVLTLARAVAHAHARGVSHGAVRPEAVTFPRSGGLKLGDFSEAEAPALGLPERSETPETAEQASRVEHKAPEQLTGEPASPAGDVWSLAVIFHELVTGAGAFGSPDPQTPDRRTIAQKIRAAEIAPLPESVPRAFARIIQRGLSKLAEDRFPDAGAMADALEAALTAESALPAPVLIGKALARARLGEEPAPSGGPQRPGKRASTGGPDVRGALPALGLLSALILGGAIAIEALRDAGPTTEGAAPGGSTDSPAGPRDRGLLRVVARPWAEVFIDGELVDTTPVGRPIPVMPGKHYVTFRHPKAPDEQRSIKILGGQTVFLDVTMRIDRGPADAGSDAGKASDSP
ncbi:MAG: protein kinase [Byssovorax sp.]